MRINLNKIIVLTIVFFSVLQFNGTIAFADATIDKHALTVRVQVKVESLLKNQLDPSADRQTLDLVGSRSHRIADTINALSTDNIDSDLADWIEQSILGLVNNRASVLVTDTPAADNLINGFIAQANQRLTTLDNAKGHKLLERKLFLLQSASSYRASLLKLIGEKLSVSGTLRVDLGVSAIRAMNDTSLSKIIAALDAKPDPQNPNNFVDLRTHALPSHIATLALVYNLRYDFYKLGIRNSFSYGNLFSRVFDDGDPEHALVTKDFSSISSKLNTLLSSSVETHNGMTTIVFYGLEAFISEADNQRYPSSRNSQNSSGLGKLPAAYVVFTNDKDAWVLLPTG